MHCDRNAVGGIECGKGDTWLTDNRIHKMRVTNRDLRVPAEP